jgi:hypothetical protein
MGTRPACETVAKVWDQVIADFLEGKPTNTRPPIDCWCKSYTGPGVELEAFPEPYLGDLFGEPKAVFLALNPGPAALDVKSERGDFQSRTGIFANEIRKIGSYRAWASSWPYFRKPWGHNSHHFPRMEFLKRWMGQ